MRRWKSCEEKTLKEIYMNYSNKELSEMFGRSEASIDYKITKKMKSLNQIDRFNDNVERNKYSEMCSIRIYSKSIYDGLISNNVVQNKTKSDIFPKINDKKLFLHFLRGYIDGDGSYIIRNIKGHEYPQISIAGNNVYMFEYIIKRLKDDFDIFASYHTDRNSYKLQIRRKREVIKLIHLMFDDANIFLDRKFDKINKIKSIAV